MDQQEKLYKDGFNSGYFLAQHEPQLAEIILDATRNATAHNEYVAGLSTGHDVYVAEKFFTKNKDAGGAHETHSPKKSDPEKDFVKGFNGGYQLSKYEPQLAKVLITPQKNPPPYYKGLAAGKQQHEMEKVKTRLKGISKPDAPKKDVRNRGRGK